MKSSKKETLSICPCDSSKLYIDCCKVFHTGKAPPTAEALMRSRYSGYAFGLEEYLLQTWHPETRPTEINLKKDHAIKWLGLQVQEVKSISESNATVDFIAHYKINGKSGHMHELSKFVCLVGRWYYRTGTDLNNTQDAFNLVRIDKAHNRFQ